MEPLTITAEEFVAAFQQDFPREYELVALRLVNGAQRRRIEELELVASGVLEDGHHGHSHPHD